MSDKEKSVIEKIGELLPKLSDFDKGTILGTVEQMARESTKED